MSGLLELENVSSGYGGTPVLRSVTLEVARGEAVALIGANGAGQIDTSQNDHGHGEAERRRNPV